MFADFGEEQQRRDRLTRQNKDHLDALRAQLEGDRIRKRYERSGISAPPQRFLPGQDPSHASAPAMLKAPPAGAPYRAARQLAPEAALPHELEQRWRAVPPNNSRDARQTAAPPAAAVDGQEVRFSPLQQEQEQAFRQQRARTAENVAAARYAQQKQEQQDYEDRQQENEYIRQQEALALQRQALQPPKQLLPHAKPPGPAFAAHRDGDIDERRGPPNGFASPAIGFAAPTDIYSSPAQDGTDPTNASALMDRIEQLERVAEVSVRENRSLREQCAALQATLETSLRMADEKLNQEIRQRAELQMQVHTNAIIGEKESATAGSSFEQLSRQVEMLLRKQEGQEEEVRALAMAVHEAREAREAAERIGDELSHVAQTNQTRTDALAERSDMNNRAIEEVQSNLLANAEQVGEVLRSRSLAIELLESRGAEQAAAAASQVARLEALLQGLAGEQRHLLSQLEEERRERATAEQRAEEALAEAERAFAAQQSALKEQTDAALQQVGGQLEQRERAEAALLHRLRTQHQQQGQLEDVGVSVQAANALTFEDMREALQAVDASAQEERAARDEAIRDVRRDTAAAIEARVEELRASEARAAEAHATLEQVLRTEIKARMRGEAQMQAAHKQQGFEFHDGQRALQGDLQEAVLAIRGQVRAAVVENAQHSTRTEEALVRAAERQRNVDAAHELALQALAKQLGAQAAAAAEALRNAEESISADLCSLSERKTAELEGALDTIEERITEASEQSAAELAEVRGALLVKIGEAIGIVVQERAERRSAEVEAAAAREVRDAINAALATTQTRQQNEALNATGVAIETARRQLITEVWLARQAAAEATAELSAAVGAHTAEIHGLHSRADLLSASIEAEAEARQAADDDAQVAAAVECMVCTVAEQAAAEERTALADESHRLRAADFTLHANLNTLREALARSSDSAEEGLRDLEQHCAHQLQHGLDALGANLEHLIETGVALEATERQNACAQLAAVAASQLDELEGLVHSQRAAAAAEVGELQAAVEAKDCVDRLIASLEEVERSDEVARINMPHAALAAQLDEMGPELVSGIRSTALALEASFLKSAEELAHLAAAHERLASDVALGHDRQTQALADEAAARVAASTEALVSIAEARAEAEAASAALQKDVTDSAIHSSMSQMVATVETEAMLSALLADGAAKAEIREREAAADRLALKQVEIGLSARIAASFKKLEERHVAAETATAARFDAVSRSQAEEVAARCAALEDTAVHAAVEETVERAVLALEANDEMERRAEHDRRLASLEQVIMIQRQEAHEMENASTATSSKLTSVMDTEVARLTAKVERAREAQDAALKGVCDDMAAKAAERDAALEEQLGGMRAELATATAAAESAARACGDKVKQAEEQAERVAAEIRGLRAGLGLNSESTDPLAKASELKRLQERVEAELAEARADLKRSHERFAAAAERMGVEADEGARQSEAKRMRAETERAAAEAQAAENVRQRSRAEAEAAAARAGAAMEAAQARPKPKPQPTHPQSKTPDVTAGHNVEAAQAPPQPQPPEPNLEPQPPEPESEAPNAGEERTSQDRL